MLTLDLINTVAFGGVVLSVGYGVRRLIPGEDKESYALLDAAGLIGLSQRTIDDLGSVALSLFLVLAPMTLRLWELVGLALADGRDPDGPGRADRGGLLAHVPDHGPGL
jgi:sodium--glutamate symport carrier gltS